MHSIYEIKNWSELFRKYEQLTSLKVCSSCWTDKVKVYNYFRNLEMAKKVEKENGTTWQFKPEFEGCQVIIKSLGYQITKENLTTEIVEKYFKNEPALLALIELV